MSSSEILPPPVAAYLEACDAFDVEGMLAQVSPDVTFLNLSGGKISHRAEGLDQLAELARAATAAFAERRQEIISAITDDDRTTLHIRYHGRVAADLPDGWKAGQVLELKGVSLFRLADGKIRSILLDQQRN